MAYYPASNMSSVLKVVVPDGVKLFIHRGLAEDPFIGGYYSFGISFSERLAESISTPVYLAELLEDIARQIREGIK